MIAKKIHSFVDDEDGIASIELGYWLLFIIMIIIAMLTYPYVYARLTQSFQVAQNTAELMARESTSSVFLLTTADEALVKMQDYAPLSKANIRVTAVEFQTGAAPGASTNTVFCFSRVNNTASERLDGQSQFLPLEPLQPLTSAPVIPDGFKTRSGALFVVEVRIRVLSITINRTEYRRPLRASQIYYKENAAVPVTSTCG